MIQGYTIARELESTEAELMGTVFPHPTVSESMHEAVLAAYDRALHLTISIFLLKEIHMLTLNKLDLFRQQCHIDGQWVNAYEGGVVSVNNPATGEIIGTIPKMGGSETHRAIDTANTSWCGWRKKFAKERATILRRWFDLMIANSDDLAKIMTVEQGKPLAESKGEIAYVASYLEWFAKKASAPTATPSPDRRPTRRIVVVKEPIGVCAVITPWNFPVIHDHP